MATLSVVYPSGGTRFDRVYYRDRHVPLVRATWEDAGLTGVDFAFGEASLDGGASPFHCIATLRFGSRAELDAAAGGPGAGAVFADIANFTDAVPVGMIGEAG